MMAGPPAAQLAMDGGSKWKECAGEENRSSVFLPPPPPPMNPRFCFLELTFLAARTLPKVRLRQMPYVGMKCPAVR